MKYLKKIGILTIAAAFVAFMSGASALAQGVTLNSPTGLSVTSNTPSSIGLSWIAPATSGTSTIAGYNVIRNGSQVGVTGSTNFDDMGLTTGTTYAYNVSAFDSSGDVSPWSSTLFASTQGSDSSTSTATSTATSTLPSIPTGLTASSTSDSTVGLSWTASTDPNFTPPMLTYQIFRDGIQATTTAAGITTFTDTGLTGGTSYSYTVAAVDPNNNNSGQSSAVTVMTTGSSGNSSSTLPSIPTGLTASSTSNSSIMVSWTASTDSNFTPSQLTYMVFRNGTEVGTTAAGATSFTDNGLTGGTSYSYTVAAVDPNNNNSGQSSAVSAMTTGTSGTSTSTLPSIPIGLMVSSTTGSTVGLSWTASTDSNYTPSQLTYALYRGGSQIATTTAGATTFTDTGLSSGTSYSYTIAAMDPAGNSSGQSAAVSAMTSGATMTSTTTPSTFFGWLVIPSSIFNMLGATTSTSTITSSSPYVYVNGYPMWGSNYVNCNGNVDNDPAHHTTDPNDTDPAHHVGMNCPGGAPQNPSGWTGSSGSANPFGISNTTNSPWVVIPLTQVTLQDLLNIAGMQ